MIYYVFLFILGLGFGSFASVVICRLHKKERGIFFGRSKCPSCQTKLGAIDLLPLVGYAVNRFKCRYCKSPIALMYPLLELSMGALFVLTAYMVGFGSILDLVYYLLMSFVFVVLIFYDILFQEVPDEISLPAVAVGIIYVALTREFTFYQAFTGVFVPVGFFTLLSVASRGRWLGGGDIRIGGLMGILLGWPNVLIGLFLAYLSGSVVSLFGLALGKLHRKSHIPFAPFLLLGAYVALFWGDGILKWYMGMMM